MVFAKKNLSELNRLNVEEFKATDKISLVVVLDNVRSQHNVGAVFRTSDAFLVEKIYLCGITATPPNRDIHKAALGATESVEWQYFSKTVDAVNDLKRQGFSIFALEQTQHSISFLEFGDVPVRRRFHLRRSISGRLHLPMQAQPAKNNRTAENPPPNEESVSEQVSRFVRNDGTLRLSKPIALILGNEVDGISDDVLPLIDGAFEIPQFGTKHSLNVSVSAGIAIWELFKFLKKID
ncbi:MAG: RNA methyltransferase [Bacteroidales bacterium]|jgi:tRNA G18 (ribose-2'-O)-methylase SpoU|nr:RNA methyltransferase [Bacteroidales bacterium]